MSSNRHCGLCNYSTNDRSNWAKHVKSVKHKKALENYHVSSPKTVKISPKTVQISPKTVKKCGHCGRDFKYKRSLDRHLDRCKKKQDTEMREAMNKVATVQSELNAALLKEKQDLEERLAESKQTEQEYLALIHKLAENKGNTTIINNSGPTIMNAVFITKNCNEAYNYEDLMNGQLTDKEIRYVQDKGASVGCEQLIYDRCIEGVDVMKRPIHCVDTAREKFMLRTDGQWVNDYKGKQMMKRAHNMITESLRIDPQNDAPNEVVYKATELKNMHTNSKKIVRFIGEKTATKNMCLED